MKKNWIIAMFGLSFILAAPGCEDEKDELDPDAGEEIPGAPGSGDNENFKAPTYKDDYRLDITNTWAGRKCWNLANVHDPSVAYFNGYYYMYQTDASYGNVHEASGGHFIGRRSKDLVNWDVLDKPAMMGQAPAWVLEHVNGLRAEMGLKAIANPQYGYWAPVIRKATRNGVDVLRMYYSIVIDNYIKSGAVNGSAFDGSWTERAYIGMCETTDPVSGNWTDYGMVVCSSSDKGINGYSRANQDNWDAYFYFNAIDPTVISTPEGKDYMIYGSWHSGFASIELDPESGMPVQKLGKPWASSAAELAANGYGTRVGARNSSRWQGAEGADIIEKDGKYYMFMAYDGLDVPYHTRVVRSDEPTTNYTDMTGKRFKMTPGDTYPIVTHPYKFKRGTGWVGISHVGVFRREGTDDYFLTSQARLPKNNADPYANAVMMGHVRKLIWCPSSASSLDDLWPIASPERYAGEVQTPVKESELVGSWENINLQYTYAEQCKADEVYVVLNADHTCTGSLGKTWSYDESTQFLTIGSIVVKVERGVDWEATSRPLTLVYAGCDKNTKLTYWGKKK